MPVPRAGGTAAGGERRHSVATSHPVLAGQRQSWTQRTPSSLSKRSPQMSAECQHRKANISLGSGSAALHRAQHRTAAPRVPEQP